MKPVKTMIILLVLSFASLAFAGKADCCKPGAKCCKTGSSCCAKQIPR